MKDDACAAVSDPDATARTTTARTSLYAAPPGIASSLRVVLVVPRRMPAWLLRFFDLAAGNPWLDLTVLPIDGRPAPTALSVPADLRALLRYERGRTADVAMARVLVEGHEGVEFTAPVRSDLDAAALRARVGLLLPDLVLLVGAPHWAEVLGDRAQWGCWDLDPSITDARRAAQVLLAPVMRGDVATAVELQLHHLDRTTTMLARSWVSTCRASASLQCQQASLKIPALLMRSLRELAHGNLQVPRQRTARLQLAADAPGGFGPGLRAIAGTLAFRLASRWQRRSQPCEGAWHVLLRHGSGPLDPAAPDVPHHSLLLPPGNHFWADPWVLEDAGRRLVFVEQWTRDNGKGVIACLELLPGDRVRNLGVVLEHPFHLSYPQVFQWQGQWYLTVESGQAGCVSLYRAEAFPDRWQLVSNLLEGWACVDPTLHHHDNHWYLFANVAEGGGSSSDELFLFVADQLSGPFSPHPANPIVSDARRARPAGRLFRRDGRLIRPAQDCAPSYGAAIVFNEVLELSPTHYRERPSGRLHPYWSPGLDGCHTYNEAAGIEVLDARGVVPAGSVRYTLVDGPFEHGVDTAMDRASVPPELFCSGDDPGLDQRSAG